jgi:hypothetical protein
MKSLLNRRTRLLMKMWRGTRLQGLIIKFLVVTLVVTGFRATLFALGALDKRHFLHGSARHYLIEEPMVVMISVEPVLWVWFLVVSLFGVAIMYKVHQQKPEEQKSVSS